MCLQKFNLIESKSRLYASESSYSMSIHRLERTNTMSLIASLKTVMKGKFRDRELPRKGPELQK